MVFQPPNCFRKFYVIEKFQKPCRCMFKCKFPPPSTPIVIKNRKDDIVRYDSKTGCANDPRSQECIAAWDRVDDACPTKIRYRPPRKRKTRVTYKRKQKSLAEQVIDTEQELRTLKREMSRQLLDY